MAFNINRDLNNKPIKKNVINSATPKITSNRFALASSSPNLEQLTINNIPITASGSNINTIDVSPGVAVPNKALVVDSNKDINNINTISCNTLTVNNQPVTGLYTSSNTLSSNSQYINEILEGTAVPNKLLTTNSTKDIKNINSITSKNLILNNSTVKFNNYENIRQNNIYLNISGYIPSNVTDIYYLSSSNLYLACTSDGYIFSSSDMNIWIQKYYDSTMSFTSMSYSSSLNKFIVVGLNKILYSSDNGLNWTTITIANSTGLDSVSYSQKFKSVCWSPTLNKFSALSNCGSYYYNAGNVTKYIINSYTSTDGINWSLYGNIAATWTDITGSVTIDSNILSWNSYNNKFEYFNGDGGYITSTTGAGYTIYLNNNISKVYLYNPFTNLYYGQYNGINGSSTTENIATNNTSIINLNNVINYSLTLKKIIGRNSQGYLMITSDLINWDVLNYCPYSLTTFRIDNNMIDSNGNPLYMNSMYNYILNLDVNNINTQLDLISYTKINNTNAKNIISICRSDSLNLFVGITNNTSDKQIATSTNGYIWELQTTPTNNWTSVCWSPNLLLFVAVANSDNNRVMISSDGINWNNQNINFLNKIQGLPTKSVSLGYESSAVILSNGTIRTVGQGIGGQLGNGTNSSSSPNSVLVSNINNCIQIVSSKRINGYNMALLSDGTIKTWGYNDNGQLGNNSTTNSNIPVTVSGITTAIDISAGNDHGMALLSNGTIKCWGYNYYGQLGNNSTTSSNIPVSVSNITNAIAISAGANFCVALLSDGTIKSWGLNSNGQLGNASNTQSNIPVTVSDITNAIAISAGASFCLALLSDGTIKSWGYNASGQLGNNSTGNSNIPVNVDNINNAIEISAGFNHSLALLNDGTVKGWGSNVSGELGINSINNNSLIPVIMPNINNVISIATGVNSSAILLQSGLLYTCGSNTYYNLFCGTVPSKSIPTLCLSNTIYNVLINIKINTIATNNNSYKDNNWVSVCWSNKLKLFAAVSNTGSYDNIMTSPDGINWSTQYCINYPWINIQTLNNDGFLIYANINNITKIFTSANGIHWFETLSSSNIINWISSKESRLYFASNNIHNEYSYNNLLYPSYTFTSISTNISSLTISNIIYSIYNNYKCIYINKLNLFILFSTNSNKIYLSFNNTNYFTEYTLPYTSSWSDLAWSENLNSFILTSSNNNQTHMIKSKELINNGINNNLHFSKDTIRYKLLTITPSFLNASSILYNDIQWINEINNYYGYTSKFAYSKELKLLVSGLTTCSSINATTAYGVVTANLSVNGFTNFTNRIIPANSATLMGSWISTYWCTQLKMFFIGNTNKTTGMLNRILYSKDGINWNVSYSNDTPAYDNQIISFEWISQLNLLVAYCVKGSLYTYDGINWSTGLITNSGTLYNKYCCYSPELKLFVSCSTTANTILYGKAFTTFTSATIPATFIYITWIKELYLFVALSNSAVCYISNNGINWTSSNLPVSCNCVKWIDKISSLAFINSSSSTTPIYLCKINSNNIDLTHLNNSIANYTNDAINNWYSKTSSSNNIWKSITYSGDLNLFVAVSNSGINNRVMTSPNGHNWTSRTTPTNNNWTSVCWVSELDLFIAVSNTGTNNRVMTSSDGISWSSRSSAADNNWTSICWSPNLNLLVAVSNSGTNNRVMTSPDGISWTSRTSAADNNWTSVCWSNIGLFVAVANSGTNNRVMTSPDGITWTSRTTINNNWNSVCWAENISMFIAVSSTGTNNRVMTSLDGITWSIQTTLLNNDWNTICWADELNLAVAISSTNVMKSIDGINWNSMSLTDNNWSSICWAKELGIFAAVSSSGTSNNVMISNITTIDIQNSITKLNTKGINVEQTYRRLLSFGSTSNINSSGMSITSNANDQTLRLTNNGSATNNVDFDVVTSPALQLNITLNGSNKIFNLVNHNGSTTGLKLQNTLITASATDINKLEITNGIASNSKLLYVDNSLNLSNVNTLSANKLLINNDLILSTNDNNSIYFNNITPGTTLPSQFIIPDSNINVTNLNNVNMQKLNIKGNNIINEPKFTNYNTTKGLTKGVCYNKYPSNINCYGICWSPKLSLFVAVGDCWQNAAGSYYKIMASSDGINWEYRATDYLNYSLRDVCWSPELSLFVAVGDGGYILTSNDGLNWITRITTGNELKSVTWSSALNLFVVVSTSGTYRIQTSSNGITWTSQTSFTNTSNWYSIIWASGLSMFVAVANTGTLTTQIATSTNGISWTLRTSPVANAWTSVAYSPILNLLVAVSNTGTKRIMTSSNGTTWVSNANTNTNNWIAIHWATSLNLFIAVANSGTGNRVFTSSNGSTWSLSTTTNVDLDYQCITSSPSLNMIVAGGNNSSGDYLCTKMAYSNNGTSWTLINTNYDGWNRIIWVESQNTYIGCSTSSGYMKRIIKSSDGINWTLYTSNIGSLFGSSTTFLDIIWVPELNLYLAAGGTNLIAKSSDGITWSPSQYGALGGLINIKKIIWSSSLQLLLALSYGGTAPYQLLTSSDAITWTLRSHPSVSYTLIDITWSPELNLFAAVSSTNYMNQIMTSPDGINWTLINNTSTVSFSLSNIIWISSLNTFLATGSGTYMLKSSDGINWTTISSPKTTDNVNIQNVQDRPIWISHLNCLAFIILNSRTHNKLVYTYDLNKWQAQTLSYYNNNAYKSIVYSNTLKQFIIYSQSNTLPYMPLITHNLNPSANINNINLSNIKSQLSLNSTMVNNAITNWQTMNFTYSNNLTSICYSRYLNTLVAVANTGTGNRVVQSYDGIIWTTRTSAADNNWTSVCWSNYLNLFVAIANSGSGNRIMTSPDGITWTIRTSPADNNWTSICWSEELKVFVAVANSGTNNRFMSSANGTSWNILPVTINNDWTSIIWASELSLFIAISSSGINNRIITSSDCITWTSQTSPADNNWTSLCWSPELNLIVAVSSSGINNRIMTSPDGITWTSQISPADNNWTSVCWAPQIRTFAAVSNSGTNNRIMTSLDGINWNIQTSPADNNWSSIVWNPSSCAFIAVSTTGTNDRILLSNNSDILSLDTVIKTNQNSFKLTQDTNRVGLGVNNPSYQLHLSTSAALKPGTSTWTISSDRRLKENIENANLDICYENIKNLPLKRYKWKDKYITNDISSDRHILGWIAQEVEQILPKSVKTKSLYGIDDCKTLNNDQIIANMHGCVKKILNIYEMQNSKIKNLLNDIKNMKQFINDNLILE